MAIVINGSGTVTGISVGGLPDGIVDDGTLATDSVTAAKLEVSAITGADLPAGSVLQVVRMQTTTATSSTSSSFVDITDLDIQITPSATSSKVLVIASVKGINPDGGAGNSLTGVSLQLLDSDGSTAMDYDENHGYNIGDDGAMNSATSLTGLSSPSSTSELTYKVQGRNRQVVAWSVSGSTNTRCSMVAMEIAG